jgi:hypothetical protein
MFAPTMFVTMTFVAMTSVTSPRRSVLVKFSGFPRRHLNPRSQHYSRIRVRS